MQRGTAAKKWGRLLREASGSTRERRIPNLSESRHAEPGEETAQVFGCNQCENANDVQRNEVSLLQKEFASWQREKRAGRVTRCGECVMSKEPESEA